MGWRHQNCTEGGEVGLCKSQTSCPCYSVQTPSTTCTDCWSLSRYHSKIPVHKKNFKIIYKHTFWKYKTPAAKVLKRISEILYNKIMNEHLQKEKPNSSSSKRAQLDLVLSLCKCVFILSLYKSTNNGDRQERTVFRTFLRVSYIFMACVPCSVSPVCRCLLSVKKIQEYGPQRWRHPYVPGLGWEKTISQQQT